MAKLNSGITTRPRSVFKTDGKTHTFENGVGYKHTDKTDLFLTAVTSFYGEDTFYENAATRNSRFVGLVRSVTRNDPAWVRSFIHWLHHDANMRTGALVAAVEYAQAGGPSPRAVIRNVCIRADEPGEILAYIKSSGYRFSGGVQRGVADAANKLYNEFNTLKYDSNQRSFRFGDVVELARPKPKAAWQSDLYKYVIDDRHGRAIVPESLEMLDKRANLNKAFLNAPVETTNIVLQNPELLYNAGMTWEAISTYGAMDAAKWEAVIPQMGYMALIRNLRNFDQAGISGAAQRHVAALIADPVKVAKSRQLPYRFFAAYSNTQNDRYRSALSDALDLSLKNLPTELSNSLILIDTSASMRGTMSAKSTMSRITSAGLFGIALGKALPNADVQMFATSVAPYKMSRGASTLRELELFVQKVGAVGHGTNIPAAVATFNPARHNRIFLLSDMQTVGAVRSTVNAPIYGFNLAGYGNTALDLTQRNRYEMGGLTDATFKMITMLESGKTGRWPWDSN